VKTFSGSDGRVVVTIPSFDIDLDTVGGGLLMVSMMEIKNAARKGS
jgi:hypothetical protein